KLSKYLVQLDTEVHILTVDPKYASYSSRDQSLIREVSPHIKVHTSYSFELINLYGQMMGKDKIPTGGFSNVTNKGLLQRSAMWVRSNLFHPDPRVGWRRFGVRKALSLLKEFHFDAIITSSPPHSTQLIGLDVKRKYPQLRWIADLRDPWTDIFYYDILNKAAFAKRIDQRLERKVLEQCDHLITISAGFRSVFAAKLAAELKGKFSIIPNGFDPADFSTPPPPKDSGFTITYTGTIADSYQPESIFDAVKKLQQLHSGEGIRLKFVGILAPSLRDYLTVNDITFESIPPVSHQKVVKIQRAAHILLLVSPEMNGGDFIIPGKAFEYLASGNPILGLANRGSETDQLLQLTNSGKCFGRDESEGIFNFIAEQFDRYRNGQPHQTDPKKIGSYSRVAQAKAVWELI
ncbi:MAG: glycosyltransferase, partial [Bacteroidota bacterium]